MPLLDLDITKARDLFDLNVWSVVSVTRAFLPLLMKSTHEQGALMVVNTSGSSITSGMMPFAGAYNASKAAAAGITETFRLELEPFGIRVINLMTGGIRSTFFNNVPDPVLPPDSRYIVAKEDVERTMSGADKVNHSDPEVWARQVVGDLSKRKPAYWIWRGKFSTLGWIASHMPVGSLDGFMKRITGLDVVEKKIKDQQAL
ncbi:hypothetical protein BJY04DRAFT_183804 [Aspergillus karnatakaensis]|uniref:uncharacterized protein n=1 Tax=Aspergillus karnatakaensis TaxID=1810916 RepID=UPI003CCDE670